MISCKLYSNYKLFIKVNSELFYKFAFFHLPIVVHCLCSFMLNMNYVLLNIYMNVYNENLFYHVTSCTVICIDTG